MEKLEKECMFRDSHKHIIRPNSDIFFSSEIETFFTKRERILSSNTNSLQNLSEDMM